MNFFKLLRSLCLVLFSYLTTSCFGQDSSDVETYRFQDEFLFELSVPCMPTIDSSIYKYYNSLKLECKDGTDEYSLQVVEYSNGMYSSDSVKRIDYDLEYSQKDFVSSNYVKIWNTFPRMVRGYPGKEYRYEYLDKNRVRFTRVYIIKNLLYRLIYEGVKSSAYDNKIDDFFDSFNPKNIKLRQPPYFYMPEKLDLENLPFKVTFPGVTEKRTEVHENFLGKSPVYMQSYKSENPYKDGYLVLMSSYSPFREDLSKEDKDELIADQKGLLENSQANIKLVSESEIDSGYEFISEYDLAGIRVRDRRRVYMKENNYFIIMVLKIAGTPDNSVINIFLNSVEIQ